MRDCCGDSGGGRPAWGASATSHAMTLTRSAPSSSPRPFSRRLSCAGVRPICAARAFCSASWTCRNMRIIFPSLVMSALRLVDLEVAADGPALLEVMAGGEHAVLAAGAAVHDPLQVVGAAMGEHLAVAERRVLQQDRRADPPDQLLHRADVG